MNNYTDRLQRDADTCDSPKPSTPLTQEGEDISKIIEELDTLCYQIRERHGLPATSRQIELLIIKLKSISSLSVKAEMGNEYDELIRLMKGLHNEPHYVILAWAMRFCNTEQLAIIHDKLSRRIPNNITSSIHMKEETVAGKREFIICSAVHYRDGVVRKQQPVNIESGLVVCGRRHNNCFQTLEEIVGFDITLVKATDMGFLTSNNEFKTRKEAMIIATKENQIYHNVPYTQGDILTSEDLFLDNDNPSPEEKDTVTEWKEETKTENMQTGIELIAAERQEQIKKHGRTVQLDVMQNSNKQLSKGAHELLHEHPSNMGFPKEWDKAIVHRMASKPYKERLVIAGALIAAELDRINASNNIVNPTGEYVSVYDRKDPK